MPSSPAPSAEAARVHLQSLDKDSIAFRLLDALLTHAPTDEGQGVIAADIVTASAEEDGLNQLAAFYQTGLLLQLSGPYLGQTLHRDGHRCVVTRWWDLLSLKLPHVRDKFDPNDDTATATEAAHILPLSLMTADTTKTLFNKCTISSVIKSFARIEFEELNSINVNSLTNVITLDTTIHKFFGSLDLCFEAMPGKANTYRIRKLPRYIFGATVNEGTEVTLTSPDPGAYPIPDPRYLAFHAAVAKVVHTAGMAEHLDDTLRKYEDIRVLSNDLGVEYLDGLLRMAQRCMVTH